MSEYILEMNGITKEFHGVKSLNNVNLRARSALQSAKFFDCIEVTRTAFVTDRYFKFG